MNDLKIVIVGGGSCFVLSKIKVLLEKKNIFEGSEVCLFDIEYKYFPLLIKASKEMCKKEGANLKITSTTDPKKAFENASFIYFVYNVGGKEALRNDIEIPSKLNIIGDETAGIGGTFMAQRNIPVAINYCKIIEKICPDAWIINLTNPTNLITDAVRRETGVKFIALCDCFCEMAMKWLPKVLNKPPFDRKFHTSKDLWPRTMGVNHYTWLTQLMVDGRDGYTLLRRIIKESKDKILDDITSSYGNQDIPYNLFEAYNYYGCCPIHTQFYYESNVVLEKHKDFDGTFYNGAMGWNTERHTRIKEISEGSDYNESPWGDSKDYCFQLSTPRQLIGVMASILTNDGREWGGVNFPNTGVIPNLPKGSIVEGPSIMNAMGSNPVPMGELPKPFIGLSQHLINWAELSVDAALSGDKKILYQAILASPLVSEMRAAKEIMDNMLKLNKRFLPQYKI